MLFLAWCCSPLCAALSSIQMAVISWDFSLQRNINVFVHETYRGSNARQHYRVPASPPGSDIATRNCLWRVSCSFWIQINFRPCLQWSAQLNQCFSAASSLYRTVLLSAYGRHARQLSCFAAQWVFVLFCVISLCFCVKLLSWVCLPVYSERVCEG